MDFISQYVLANSGTEVPIRYTRWCAVSLLSTTLGKKVFVDHGHFVLWPWLYFCLIGTQGSGKTTAMEQAQDMLIKALPDYPTGVDITSREDIIRYMASDKCERFYINEAGDAMSWRPIANFISELSNFLSFAPGSMIEFMTTIFDRKVYVSRTIKRDQEVILNPFFSFLACTLPETMIDYLRMKVMGGGMLRRLIMIYDLSKAPVITFPVKSKEALAAEEWCTIHLQRIYSLVGPFSWASGSREFLAKWNEEKKNPEDHLLAGYYGKKVNIVQKVAMCVACAEESPKLEFTPSNLGKAILLLDSNEDNLSRLTVAVGRNELAAPQAKLVQTLFDNDGWMSEKKWHKMSAQDMSEREYYEMKTFLKATDQLHEHKVDFEGWNEVMVITHIKWLELVKSGGIKIQ